ncbi:hypothetical protein GQ607_011006 [Colletotrichum asianum]|uniref:Uncharacterized protein n=1 Tax=Colletotrichum asianum TaxID=702518 RepID=A0A8H3W8B7_9PEZI|nr:hypothetical protein GQ607_011006 [Colletotrichum asianum]
MQCTFHSVIDIPLESIAHNSPRPAPMLNLSADLNHHRARPVIGPAHGATRTRAHLFFSNPAYWGRPFNLKHCTLSASRASGDQGPRQSPKTM